MIITKMMTLNIFLGMLKPGPLLVILLLIVITVAIVRLVKIANKTVKGNSLNQLEKLHELKQKGIITEEEFNKQKAELV